MLQTSKNIHIIKMEEKTVLLAILAIKCTCDLECDMFKALIANLPLHAWREPNVMATSKSQELLQCSQSFLMAPRTFMC